MLVIECEIYMEMQSCDGEEGEVFVKEQNENLHVCFTIRHVFKYIEEHPKVAVVGG